MLSDGVNYFEAFSEAFVHLRSIKTDIDGNVQGTGVTRGQAFITLCYVCLVL